MKFSSLITEDLSDDSGPRFRLIQPLTYAHSSGTIVVPEGFITDLASIPRIFWNVLPPVDAYDKAAVVHDWLYRVNGRTRGQCDQILEDGMKDLKVSGTKLRLIYWGVRLGGWKPWNKYRSEDQHAPK